MTKCAALYELTLQVTIFILLLVLGELFGVAILVIFVHIVTVSIRTLGLKQTTSKYNC